MSRLSTIKEIFELIVHRRRFYMFPVVILLIVLIGITALSQSGLTEPIDVEIGEQTLDEMCIVGLYLLYKPL